MRWAGGQRSSHIEDRRARTGVGRGAVGGGLGLVVAVVLSLVFGRDFVSGYVGSQLVALAALTILMLVLTLRPGGIFAQGAERRV